MRNRKLLGFLVFGLLSFVIVIFFGQQVHAQNISTFEQGVIDEINRARANPPAYARLMEKIKQTYDITNQSFQIPGQRDRFPVVGDLKAFDEAISELQKMSPVPILRSSYGLSTAAAIHASEQSTITAISQISSMGKDGSTPRERVDRYGSTTGVILESIGVGSSPENIVMTLMLDNGTLIRGHRQNLLKPTLRLIGVACSNHSLGNNEGKICVMDFTQEYSEPAANFPNQQETIQDIPPNPRLCGFFGGHC